MGKISYCDNVFRMSQSYIQRDYKEMNDWINGNKQVDLYGETVGEQYYGFEVVLNQALTQIYGFKCYVVKFKFINCDTLHNEEQNLKMEIMLEELKKYIKKNSGYYNLRIPTHVVDLSKAFNTVFANETTIFCGGTVEEVIHGKNVETKISDEITINFANKAYIEEYKDTFLDMTYESFKTYQGQYHISHVTADKAGIIYKNWIEAGFDEYRENSIVVAKLEDKPIGFVTLSEDENAVEGVLSAVDTSYRKYGAYKSMIAFIINYANKYGKAFIASTQFDNFIVQGAWNSLGMKPYFSIYNIHIDERGED